MSDAVPSDANTIGLGQVKVLVLSIRECRGERSSVMPVTEGRGWRSGKESLVAVDYIWGGRR